MEREKSDKWIPIREWELQFTWPSEEQVRNTVTLTGFTPSFIQGEGGNARINIESFFNCQRKEANKYRRIPQLNSRIPK